MPISRRNLIIAGFAAAAVLVVGIIVVEVVVAIRKQPDTSTIFKGCDGRAEPIQGVWLSACPDSAKAGYCAIDDSQYLDVNLTFISAKDHREAYFLISKSDRNIGAWYACDLGVKCPIKAGERQVLSKTVDPYSFDSGEYKVELEVREYITDAKSEIFCAEFPAKVIDT